MAMLHMQVYTYCYFIDFELNTTYISCATPNVRINENLANTMLLKLVFFFTSLLLVSRNCIPWFHNTFERQRNTLYLAQLFFPPYKSVVGQRRNFDFM